MKRIIQDHRGFSLVEVVLATALVGLFLSACSVGLVYGVRSTKEAGRKQQAMYFAEEGLVAVQNIRDAAYTDLVNGTWGLAITGNQWNLSGESDTNGLFTRAVTITESDAIKKQVTSTVTWADTSRKIQTISLVTYFSDWISASSSAWISGVFSGSIDLAGDQDLLKIDTVENYAYAIRDMSGSANFLIFDVSIPAAPTTVGSMTLNAVPSNIVVSGNYAYVSSANNSQELQIIDIAIPSMPTLAGSYNASGNADAKGVAISGSEAYLVREQGADKEFLVMNITTPSAPTLTGSLDLSGTGNEVAISEGYAYIASSLNAQELQVIDIVTPSAPVLIGGYDVGGSDIDALTVAVNGSIVYLGIESSLYILNDAVHGAPVLSATLAQGGTVNDITAGNGVEYLFIGTSFATGEFCIVDATTPSSPTFVNIVDLTGVSNGVAYNAALDIAVIANTDDAAELMTANHP